MRRIFLLFLLMTAVIIAAQAQEFDDESNWYREIGRGDDYMSRFDFARGYTRKDVASARKLYKEIESAPVNDEWEGVYSTFLAIGEGELRVRNKRGFVYHYVYHTLSTLEYGTVLDRGTHVRLQSGKAGISRPLAALFAERLFKIKIGSNHYLVPESRLKDFAERAAGRAITDLSEWDWWFKVGEPDISLDSLPTYPKQYSHLIVKPIETKVLSVGRRRVVRSESTTNEYNYDDIYITVTMGAGANAGVKVGMDFFVPSLGEWVEVIRVKPRTSLGRIRRDFDLEMREQCWDSEKGTGQPLPCKPITTGLSARTQRPTYF